MSKNRKEEPEYHFVATNIDYKINSESKKISRFLIFVFVPLFVFLISYIQCHKNETFKINPYSDEFFLKKKSKYPGGGGSRAKPIVLI